MQSLTQSNVGILLWRKGRGAEDPAKNLDRNIVIYSPNPKHVYSYVSSIDLEQSYYQKSVYAEDCSH